MFSIPETLIGSLKVVYVNKDAIRLSERTGDGRGRSSHQHPQPLMALSDLGASMESDLNFKQREWSRGRPNNRGGRGGRGNRGNRGNRGHRGNRGGGRERSNMVRTLSTSDILSSVDGLDLYTEDGLGDDNSQLEEPNSSSDVASAGAAAAGATNDDSGSNTDHGKSQNNPNEASAATRGRSRNEKKPSHDGRPRPRPVRGKPDLW